MKSIALHGFRFLSLNFSDYQQICENINQNVARRCQDELHHFENPKTDVRFCRPYRNTDLWCQPYFYYDNEVPAQVLQDVIEKANLAIEYSSMMFPIFEESEFLEKVESTLSKGK